MKSRSRRRTARRALGLAALLALAPLAALLADSGGTSVFVNGLWFDGGDFVPRTVVVADGRISQMDPETARARGAEEVDLDGTFVVPAFGEAHHHTVAYMADRARWFLESGIFYAKVQNIDVETGARVRDSFASPETVDLSLAMAGLTAGDGHPVQIGFRVFRSATSPAEIDARWVHIIESAEDVETKWPAVLATEPDFIKVFLLNSETYRDLKSEPGVAMRYRGMDPELVPRVVDKAHEAGLRVSAHVRTATDFRNAVEAGVDEIAHLPGFAIGPSGESDEELSDQRLLAELDEPERYQIEPRDAELAAERGVIVVTTAGRRSAIPTDLAPGVEALYRKARHVHDQVARHNLSVLKSHGVSIVIGSDAGEGNSVEEALGLQRFEVFTPTELLRMLSQETPRMIFPGRRIGCLEVGCEASFLALEDNPVESLAAIESIARLFKEGREIVVAN